MGGTIAAMATRIDRSESIHPDVDAFPLAEEPPAESVSVVIPVYNGAATISLLVESLLEANPGYRLQVVLVNDGSADGSANACRSLVSLVPGVVTFVDLARNCGEHNAVMAGLAHARGDYCVVMDDDFQNPPGEAFRLVETATRKRADVVFAEYRSKRHHWARNLGSRLANAAARRLMGLPSGIYLSSFKCLSRFVVDHVTSYRGPFPYLDGLAMRTTRNIAVIPARHDYSRKGRSGYTVGKLLQLWVSSAVNFSVLPLRVATVIGIALSTAGMAGAGIVVAEKLGRPDMPAGWASLFVATLLLAGIQLLLLGVIGEYLGQLVLTVNGTPQYVVREVRESQSAGDPGCDAD